MAVIAQYEATRDLEVVEGFYLGCDPSPAPDTCINIFHCFDEMHVSYKNHQEWQYEGALVSPVARAVYRDLANYRLPFGKKVLLLKGEVFFVESVKNIKFKKVEFKPVVSNLK